MQKILNPQWAYDHALNNALQEAQKYEEIDVDESKAQMDSVEMFKAMLNPGKSMNADFDKHLARHVKTARTNLEDLIDSKPIAIGPATADSLYKKQPDTLEYVVNEKLPFDKMFFEFVEPIEVAIPFAQTIPLTGLQFKKAKKPHLSAAMQGMMREAFQYTAVLYEHNKPQTHEVSFRPKGRDFVEGRVGNTQFSADLRWENMHYTDVDNTNIRDENMLQRTWRLLARQGMEHKRDLTTYEKNSLQDIGGLCTNIINYINAQNTTVERADRKVDVRIKDGHKNKTDTQDLPFYLVRIESRDIKEPETPSGDSWTLEERIYVRGHDRRYRHDDGTIKKTIWIEPHIRGPEGAPWRNQRYAVLGEKLEREKEFLDKIKPYATDQAH